MCVSGCVCVDVVEDTPQSMLCIHGNIRELYNISFTIRWFENQINISSKTGGEGGVGVLVVLPDIC